MSHENGDWDVSPLIVDNSTWFIKSGFTGDSAPRAVFPPVTGARKQALFAHGIGMATKQFYVGDEALDKARTLNLDLKYPIKRGVIEDWDAMEKVWHHIYYNELRVAPEEHPVIMTDSVFSHLSDRHKMAEISFETFNNLGLYIERACKLALLESGRKTGLVLHCGGGSTYAVPIYEEKIVMDGLKTVEINGTDLTNYCMKVLAEAGSHFDKTNHAVPEDEICRDIKEKLCFVAQDFKKELSHADIERKYELPDGQVISVNTERIRVPEPLFQPEMVMDPFTELKVKNMDQMKHLVNGYIRENYEVSELHAGMVEIVYEYMVSSNREDTHGVHQLVYQSAMECDGDMRKDMFGNIVLEGGCTMFGGFADRLQKEVEQLVPNPTKVKVGAVPERKYSVWIGASILTSLHSFRDKWITKEEYDEYGSSIVQRKCPI